MLFPRVSRLCYAVWSYLLSLLACAACRCCSTVLRDAHRCVVVSLQFSNLCGTVYKQGNLVFTPDGNKLLSPVGNRITLFDLVKYVCTVFQTLVRCVSCVFDRLTSYPLPVYVVAATNAAHCPQRTSVISMPLRLHHLAVTSSLLTRVSSLPAQ